MWAICTPASALNSAAEMCWEEPLPDEPKFLVGIGLQVGDQFGDGVGRNGWIDDQQIRDEGGQRDRREIGLHVERQAFVEARIGGEGRAGRHRDCITVRIGLGCGFGSDVAGRTGPVLDDDGLAEPLGKRSSDDPRRHIGAPPRRVADQNPDRFCGPRRLGV
jgi:hypothetical protein